MEMVSKNIDNSLKNGKVISIRGSVVDIWFENNLPSIYTSLHSGKDNQIVIEVLNQLDVHRVRGIALTPTQGLSREEIYRTKVIFLLHLLLLIKRPF